MKNALRLFGTLAVAATVAFTFTACGDNNGGDGGGMRITVTGIPENGARTWTMTLGHPTGMPAALSGQVTVPAAGGSVTFTMMDVLNPVAEFNTAGTYNIVITGGATLLQIQNRALTAGANTIPWSDF